MSPAVDLAECVERLLRGFITYDRAVDVVSAFQMAFTTSHSEVPGTVRHFERFPRIPGDEDSTLTPDFTVVFEDGTGLAGEIARLARYIFQRLLEPRNGTLRDGDRVDGLGRWFEENGDFKARPSRFSDIKAARAFINDPGGQALPRDPPVGEDLPHLSRREGSSGPAGGSFD